MNVYVIHCVMFHVRYVFMYVYTNDKITEIKYNKGNGNILYL